MDYDNKSLKELLIICKENNISYNKKSKKDIIKLIIDSKNNVNEVVPVEVTPVEVTPVEVTPVEVTAESVRENGLDKFYTIPSIAEKCINTLGEKYEWKSWDLVIEPSAGDGSFLLQIPTHINKRIGIDISPEHKDIIKQDFLTYNPHTYIYPNTHPHLQPNQQPNQQANQQPNLQPKQNIKLTKILVIGNPPFGKVSSLAVKFFNHSAEWATVIAFIIPKTFRRISIQNKLNKQFHLIHDDEIPTHPCSFKPPLMVKCCFQIWEKKNNNRDIIELTTKHNDWEFLPFGPLDEKNQPTPPQGADFAVRAYGGKCGDIVKDNIESLRPKSWHWIKAKISIPILIERFSSLDYSLSKNTARQNSIGRGEFVKLYSDTYD